MRHRLRVTRSRFVAAWNSTLSRFFLIRDRAIGARLAQVSFNGRRGRQQRKATMFSELEKNMADAKSPEEAR